MDCPSFGKRRQAVRSIMESNHLEGIVFFGLENIRYFCGFTGSDGVFVLTGDKAYFLTDSRYWTQADDEVAESEIVHYKKKLDGIVTLLLGQKRRRIGFDAPALPFSFYRALAERLGKEVDLVPLEEEIRNLRAVKDPQELAAIQRAIDIASKAFEHALGTVREGSLENDIAQEMEFSMKRNGAENLGFDIIVASGTRSALPHGKASTKRVEKGDFILFDYGCRAFGYHSDETITVVIGEPSAEQRKIYQIVKDAHDKAVETARSGIPLNRVDAAARDHIRNSGYGDCFGHGLGHGVGLAVHEDPTVNADNRGIVQEGMVFTIEPGIYIPDWGGVRIEDMVRVTAQGAEVMTYLSKELRVL